MLNAKISGIASYLPDYVLTNDELSRMVDTNDEWITTRVGIKERRILKKEVGSSYMGIQAVKNFLKKLALIPTMWICSFVPLQTPTTVSLLPPL